MTEENKPVEEVTEKQAPIIEQPNIEQPNIQQPSIETPPPTPTEEAVATDTGTSGIDDASEGKAFAILSYALSFIGIPFFLVPLIMRNNAFALYHAKQCLIIWLAGIVLGTISTILMAVCIGAILLPIVGIMLFVFTIIGLIKAVNCEAVPVPLIGKFAEEWFKGIQKI